MFVLILFSSNLSFYFLRNGVELATKLLSMNLLLGRLSKIQSYDGVEDSFEVIFHDLYESTLYAYVKPTQFVPEAFIVFDSFSFASRMYL